MSLACLVIIMMIILMAYNISLIKFFFFRNTGRISVYGIFCPTGAHGQPLCSPMANLIQKYFWGLGVTPKASFRIVNCVSIRIERRYCCWVLTQLTVLIVAVYDRHGRHVLRVFFYPPLIHRVFIAYLFDSNDLTSVDPYNDLSWEIKKIAII